MAHQLMYLSPETFGLNESLKLLLMIVVGGVIPSQDFAELREHGADAIYPPGTKIPESAHELLEILMERLEGAEA